MIRRYLEYALIVDFAIAIAVGAVFACCKNYFQTNFNPPTANGLDNITDGLITVVSTLMGFLLTIITVIVTFKAGFESKSTPPSIDKNRDVVTKVTDKNSGLEGVDKTIFDKITSKEDQFYESNIHKNVGLIFTNATIECGVILFILLLVQFEVLDLKRYTQIATIIIAFILITFSVVRSLHIFKYFLRVHLHTKST